MCSNDVVVIIGCGYVGLTLGITFASSEVDTIFIEKDNSKVNLLRNKKSHFFERLCFATRAVMNSVRILTLLDVYQR